MRLPKIMLGPNQARVVYDAVVSAAASLFVALFMYFTVGERTSPWFAAAPAFVLLFNRALGIYNSYRLGTGRQKTVVLTGALLLAALTLYLLSGQPAAALLWTATLWSPRADPGTGV